MLAAKSFREIWLIAAQYGASFVRMRLPMTLQAQHLEIFWMIVRRIPVFVMHFQTVWRPAFRADYFARHSASDLSATMWQPP
jgi:hypothetical protein